nr:hypothetical protein CIP107545_01158 [Corynebacterium diphtheriae]
MKFAIGITLLLLILAVLLAVAAWRFYTYDVAALL